MKSILLAAAATALVALAGPVSAQQYAPAGPSTNPYDGPAHYAPDNGPQMQYMATHGSTVLDRAPYAGNDAYSDHLSQGRSTVTIYPPGMEPE